MRYPDERSNWGINLKTFLKNEGRRFSWLAEQTGIRYRRLLDILGGRGPGIDEAVAICDALKVHPMEFYEKEK